MTSLFNLEWLELQHLRFRSVFLATKRYYCTDDTVSLLHSFVQFAAKIFIRSFIVAKHNLETIDVWELRWRHFGVNVTILRFTVLLHS